MKVLLAAGFIFLSSHADAAATAKVKRGPLKIDVSGTVVADNIFRIKATIEGRVESVLASTYTWSAAGQPLALLAHRELAAMLDSRGAQDKEILEDRWKNVYRPAAARCPDACFILKKFLKVKTWVKPESVMFEAASALKLVGRVRPEYAQWIRSGEEIIFWPVNDPKRILTGRVTQVALDATDGGTDSGATLTVILSPGLYLDPGTEWAGEIIPSSKKNVLYVPSNALIHEGDNVYLPVLVSPGITTQGLTEIETGIEDGRDILILSGQKPRGAGDIEQEADLEALRRRARGLKGAEATGPETGRPSVKGQGKHPTVIDNTDYGEDPYAEPQ